MKHTAILVAGACAALVPLMAHAQFARPEAAVRYRQSVMNLMGNHVGRIGAMVNGRVPYDQQAAAFNASLVSTLSALPFGAFGPGTDVGTHRARPEVWSDAAGFKAASEKLPALTARLADVAKSGDQAALKAAFGDVAAACKACHDKYQKE